MDRKDVRLLLMWVLKAVQCLQASVSSSVNGVKETALPGMRKAYISQH